MASISLSVLLCMDKEEWTALSPWGLNVDDVSIDALRCFLNELGPWGLYDLSDAIEGAPASLELFSEAGSCGIDLESLLSKQARPEPAPTVRPAVPVPTATPVPTAAPQREPEATPTAAPAATAVPAPTAAAAATAVPEPTAAPTATPTDTPEPTPTDTPTPAAVDRAALVALYEATDGANWTRNHNWLSDRPIGEWRGVIADLSGRVTELLLSENQLSGEIPAELGNLANLHSLLLPENQWSRPVKWCKSASSCCCCLGGCRPREIGLRKSFV